MSILVVTLRGPTEPQQGGRPIPIQVEVRNISKRGVWVVGVIDGSENGIRYPHYLPGVTLAGRVIASPPIPEDPLVGPLRLVDFCRLGPGEAFDPTKRSAGAAYLPISTFSNFVPDRAGRYQFSLVLSMESDSSERWLGRFGQDAERGAVLERIQLVPKITVRSNVLEIEVS